MCVVDCISGVIKYNYITCSAVFIIIHVSLKDLYIYIVNAATLGTKITGPINELALLLKILSLIIKGI